MIAMEVTCCKYMHDPFRAEYIYEDIYIYVYIKIHYVVPLLQL